MEDNYYLSLSQTNIIKFDAVNQLTNVYYDECRSQIFIVKSAAISVKSLDSKNGNFSFNLQSNNANLIAIKFSDGNNTLAVQRTENNLEFHAFKNNQIVPGQIIFYETKQKQGTIIYGFIWTEYDEFIVVSAEAVEMFQINMAKKQIKSLKSLSASSNFFCYSGRSSFLLLSSNNGLLLTPILIKQGALTKLAPIQIEDGAPITERDIVTGSIYNTPAILILKTRNRTLEIFVYLLEIPTFKKKHVLKLALTGRCAVSIIDSVIVVHHQTSKVSLLFDIALGEATDPVEKSVMVHSPLVVAKSIKPFSIKLPSVSLKNEMMTFELYSVNWVIFCEIIIDVKQGYLFKLDLAIDKVQIGDKTKLIEFLLHRKINAKQHLLAVLSQTIVNDEIHLPLLEIIFDKLNKVYRQKLDYDLSKMQALPSSPSTFKPFISAPPPAPIVEQPREAIVVEQSDLLPIFNSIADKNALEKILTSYIYSLVKHTITSEYDLSKLLVMTLIGNHKVHDLQQILSFQVLLESKPLACCLLSFSQHDPLISQMALDMLQRLGAHEIIVEILLEQGKVIDAMRLAKRNSNMDMAPARKYLDAALKDENKMTFYSVYNFFVSRNTRLRGTSEFLKNEQCDNYVKVYEELYPNV